MGKIAQGTVVGYKNIRRFPMVQTNKVRVRIVASRVCPTLSAVGLYKAPEMLSNPVIRRSADGLVNISCQTPDPAIYYTVDGSAPGMHSARYNGPIALPAGGMVKARAFTEKGTRHSEIIEADFDVSPAKWSVAASSNSPETFPAQNVIDGNRNTLWQSQTDGVNPFVSINLGEALILKGFTYLPRQDGKPDGICKDYQIEVSLDGKQWNMVKEGSFDNIKNDPSLRKVPFSQPVKAQYIRFTGLKNVAEETMISIAEIGLITR